MTDQKLSKKFENAIKALEIFTKRLDEIESVGWKSYFERIANCLNQKDVESAVRAFEAIPMPNMGGFGEFLDSHPELRQSYYNLSKTIGNLKVYYRYEKDRPMVEL